MLDLALGFIIGTAFATVVDSATKNLLNPLIGAIFGKASLGGLYVTVNGSKIGYGQFAQDVLNFALFALILFLILKFVAAVGVGRSRTFEEKQCPYCLEYVNPDALVCKVCRQPLVDAVPDLVAAEARAERLREPHRLHIDIPELDVKVKGLAEPLRRRSDGAHVVAELPGVPVMITASTVEAEPADAGLESADVTVVVADPPPAGS